MSTVPLIASAARAKGVSFLLAGGHAVIVHGFPRSTFDLDLIIQRDERERWLEVVTALGYSVHHEGPAFLQLNPPNQDAPPLDLMLVSGTTFDKLSADAVAAPAWSSVRVVSLLNLLALKCHAVKHGHAGRIVKDAEDVIQLIQRNRLDAESQTLRELFLRYGTSEFYDKVRRACAGT